ncbi:MAG: hypothetical protein CMM01_05245 [Rhodopirellula sp.]|nr:hypothetical protein [Rhodopirellula sp.]
MSGAKVAIAAWHERNVGSTDDRYSESLASRKIGGQKSRLSECTLVLLLGCQVRAVANHGAVIVVPEFAQTMQAAD